ncbi:MAG: response regulator [Thiolinea sp.]
MIVDDSITVRKVTEKLLLHENYLVEAARDGLEALEKLNSFEPDLMLMDIEMPRMDGFEVLEVVRQNPRWQTLPIIMISSRTAEKHREHAEQLGATDFLGKPYQNQELLELIQHHLDNSMVGVATV